MINNKITDKEVIDFLIPHIKELEEKKKHASKNSLPWDFRTSNGGVLWGGSKEDGKLYQAYCYGDLLYSHGWEEGLFEDCDQQSKASNAKVAKELGWIIKRNKEYYEIPVCPICIKKIKDEISNDELKNT